MYISMMVMALALQVSSQAGEITWQDYTQGMKQCQAQSKPMAVVLGMGEQGYTELGLSKEALEHMAANYICVYVDTTNPKNKQMADAFNIAGGKGIILSDRTGAFERYRRAGSAMSDQNLTAQLKYYSTYSSVTPVSTSTSNYQTPGATPPANPARHPPTTVQTASGADAKE